MILLVTGSKGAIGKCFVEKVKRVSDWNIIEFDLPEDDLLSEHDLVMSLERCDMVIHFAAIANLNDSMDNQDKNFEVNIRGTYLLAKYCAQLKKDLVFISTCCVYGNSLDDIETENKTAPKCVEPYATSKMAGEYILRGTPNLNYIVLRIGTVYGVGMRKELFTYIALEKVLKEEIIYIDGSGEQTRQLIHIDDLNEGMWRACTNFDNIKGKTINLCGIEKISPLDCVRIAEKITGKKAKVKKKNDRYGQTYGENIRCDLARMHLKWKPEILFDLGYKENFVKDETIGR